MNQLEAMRDPASFGKWLAASSFAAWRVVASAIFALPLHGAEFELFKKCTGRSTLLTSAARSAWLIIGRGGGKSRFAAFLALFAAVFKDYSDILAPGESGIVVVVAADKRQAKIILSYIDGFIDHIPMLQSLVVRRTAETIEFSNNISIEVRTCNYKTVRGPSIVFAVCEELAFWKDETSTSPDSAVVAAMGPAVARVPGSMILGLSSPYAPRGVLFDRHREHWGKDDSQVLVWQADTATMNPTFDRAEIENAYRDDSVSAASEYGALFRTDIETFVSRPVVEACVMPDRHELPPLPTRRYVAFADPSGGSADGFTLAIAHKEADVVVLDLVREYMPPFSPDTVVSDYATILKSYGLTRVTGDRYAGIWPAALFAKHGVTYDASARPKRDLYRDLLPLLNAGRIELLDVPKLVTQLLGLERRTHRSGKDTIDHGPGGGRHDDLCNALAGVAAEASTGRARGDLGITIGNISDFTRDPYGLDSDGLLSERNPADDKTAQAKRDAELVAQYEADERENKRVAAATARSVDRAQYQDAAVKRRQSIVSRMRAGLDTKLTEETGPDTQALAEINLPTSIYEDDE